MTKMTYVNAIDFALQILNENHFEGIEEEKAVVMDKLESLKGQLVKRNSGERKPTKTQKENEGLKAEILDLLTTEGKQCKDIAAALGLATQKVSALLKQLVDAGQAEKYTEKRVTYFKVVEG